MATTTLALCSFAAAHQQYSQTEVRRNPIEKSFRFSHGNSPIFRSYKSDESAHCCGYLEVYGSGCSLAEILLQSLNLHSQLETETETETHTRSGPESAVYGRRSADLAQYGIQFEFGAMREVIVSLTNCNQLIYLLYPSYNRSPFIYLEWSLCRTSTILADCISRREPNCVPHIHFVCSITRQIDTSPTVSRLSLSLSLTLPETDRSNGLIIEARASQSYELNFEWSLI